MGDITFGSYIVYEKLGVGGMAVVHRALKRGIAGFERVVALKRLLPHLAEDRNIVRAFVREAKLASRLSHPNIAPVYELGLVDRTYFITMEYVEGQTLLSILRHTAEQNLRVPIKVTLAILLQLCDALDHAHTRRDSSTGEPLGIVHRDISPSNLLLTPFGQLKVIDFGIANAAPEELHTQSRRVKGKFAYMAPETLDGRIPDARGDLFSTGVVAHELLTAKPLFGCSNDLETLERLRYGAITPPSCENPDCPPELDDIVLAALRRDPDHRVSSAEAMRTAVQEIISRYDLSATSDHIVDFLDFLSDTGEITIVDETFLRCETDDEELLLRPPLPTFQPGSTPDHT